MLWRIFGDAIGIKLVCRHYAFHNLVIPQGIKQDWCSQGDKVNSQQGKGFGGGFAFWQFWKWQKKFDSVHRVHVTFQFDIFFASSQDVWLGLVAGWEVGPGPNGDIFHNVGLIRSIGHNCRPSQHQSALPQAEPTNGQFSKWGKYFTTRKCFLPATQWPATKMENKIKSSLLWFFLTISLFSPHIVCLDFWTRGQLNIQYSGSGDNWQRQPIIDPARLFREVGIVQICSRHGLMAILLRNSFRGDSCLMWRRGEGRC